MAFTLTSPSFAEGRLIPNQHTCEGEGSSPELEWKDTPAGTRSLALIMHDPDTAKGDVTHWLLWDIAPDLHVIPENLGRESKGATGANEHGETSYLPPTPPPGDAPHRYIFELHALDVSRLDLARGSQRADVARAMKGHTLGVARLMGKFGRP